MLVASSNLVLEIRFEHLGVQEFGVWCDHCLLPSVGRFPGILYVGRQAQLVDLEFCSDCGRSDFRVHRPLSRSGEEERGSRRPDASSQ